ncbi:MAG: Appr-1-p processing protein [Candidatus Paceibacterota bacterium]
MIKYVIGDATNPIGEGEKYILHCCNDKNKWGAGFVLALSKRWKKPEKMYRAETKYILGTVHIVRVEKDICVINMIAQHDIKPDANGVSPIRYDALRECLIFINEIAVGTGATIHAPRFGAGLAGGDWNRIEQIIKETITVDVTIYDLK